MGIDAPENRRQHAAQHSSERVNDWIISGRMAHPFPMAVPLWKPATTATVSTISVQLTAGM